MVRTNITEFVSYADCVGIEVLDRIRRTIGEYDFAGQYQQSPAVGRRPGQGAVVPALSRQRTPAPL